jgi:corrinoid protein of di/trimethylamine methyltransferase
VDLTALTQAVVRMQDEQVIALVRQSLKENIPARSILENGLIPGMKKVGKLFKNKQYYVPEVLLASEAFYAGFNIVQPLLKSDKLSQRGKVVIGVVRGDIHDIGKNIVKVMIEATGVTVIDLGKDVPVEQFAAAVTAERPDILALSSLMTTTMPCMAAIIQELEKRKLRNAVKVIIGGAPVTAEYAEQIGADAFGRDASEAISIIDNIFRGQH